MSKGLYLFRADGGAALGAGHLMRCLTMAEALGGLQGGREEILFLCADAESGALVRAHGFSVRVLESDYRDLEGELSAWEKITAVYPGHTIIVDSYHVTDAYFQSLQRYGRVVLLDDLAEHAYPVDVVVNYNAFARREFYEELYGGTTTKCYVGSAYVPVRRQFLNRSYRAAEQVTDLLITVGGGDQDNIAGAILQKIMGETYQYHLVTGAFNPHLARLQELAEVHPNIHVHYNVQDMAGLMGKCDLAITAGGTTIYELAALGIPFICFSWAENQEALTEYVGREGVGGYAGAWHKEKDKTLENLERLTAEYTASRALRDQCSRRGKELIDGGGAERLARVLAELHAGSESV